MKGRAVVLVWLALAGVSSAGAQVTVKIGDPLPRLDTFPPGKRREIEAAIAGGFRDIWEKRWPGPVYSARDIHLTIEPRQTTFQAGSPVEVRLTLTNQSEHELRYVDLPPFYLTSLRVYDAGGHEAELTDWQPVTMISGPSPPIILLGPGETTIIRDWGRHDEWLDLKYWRYDLRNPGTYTIVGVPMVAGPTLTADTSVRSNRAEITVTK
ncbi:MAG TPA: hypothetical protein VIG08_17085 [Gemmatimonadales bacterium]|jgi:hypothetical protein